MIVALIRAETEEERLLEFLRSIFLLIAMVGFIFYGIEHWILGHWTPLGKAASPSTFPWWAFP
jgi:hypothetical protein